jgi:hypothetical protein
VPNGQDGICPERKDTLRFIWWRTALTFLLRMWVASRVEKRKPRLNAHPRRQGF